MVWGWVLIRRGARGAGQGDPCIHVLRCATLYLTRLYWTCIHALCCATLYSSHTQNWVLSIPAYMRWTAQPYITAGTYMQCTTLYSRATPAYVRCTAQHCTWKWVARTPAYMRCTAQPYILQDWIGSAYMRCTFTRLCSKVSCKYPCIHTLHCSTPHFTRVHWTHIRVMHYTL